MKKRHKLLHTGRKIIGGLSCVLIATTIITTPILANNFKTGDINQDDAINALDLASLRGYLLGMKDFSEIGKRTYEADINKDNDINSVDLALIRLLLLGNINKFPNIPMLSDSNKVNTNIKIFQDVKRIYSGFSVQSKFSIRLVNDKGEPIEGKTVRWGSRLSPNEVVYSDITVSNGVAEFSFSLTHPEDHPFNGLDELYFYFYFEGDDKNNPSVYYTKMPVPGFS